MSGLMNVESDKKMMSHSVLVTGGAGFIGTHLCHALLKLGNSVVVVDRVAPKNNILGVTYIKSDVRDITLMAKVLVDYKIDTIYHFAATVSVPLCQNDPVESYSNNFTATVLLLDLCTKIKQQTGQVIRFAFASTAALYGTRGNDGRALDETELPETFLAFYAAQKHASEKAIQQFNMAKGVPGFIFRFFNVFGEGQDPSSPYSGVITLFAKLARNNSVLLLNDGGYQTRDFVAVTDLADACAAALMLPAEQWTSMPVNLGSGTSCTIKELAQTIIKLTGSKSAIENAPAREGDVSHSKASIKRAQELLNYKPNANLTETLSDFLNLK